ncbi:MAG: beta-phosphoglucomutase, partial [Planctomycetes bacterium GWF2_42_9]
MLKYLVQAVLFDLDGVVVYTDKYHFLAWQRLAKENKWQFDEELNNKLRGIPRASSLQIILDHNGITLTQEDKETLAETKNIYYKESLKKISKDDICPGALEFINQLRATNIKTALCSSSRNTQIVLNKLQITNLFDVIITGNDIKNAKPNPEIFTLAADKLEIHPFHCLVFEDAVSGIEAARAAGMKYVGIGSSNELKKVSDAIINFDEIEIDYLLETGKIFKPIAEPWTLAETHPDIKKAKYWESMFALSNGYIGLRGTYEQNDDYLSCLEHPGMYINGIYDYEPINYTISYPGFPQQRHLMLNLCDWRIINLDIDGERFNIFEGKLLEYRRELNFKYGVVTSSIVWESPALKRIKVKITRLVSMTRLHNAVIRYEVEPITDIKYITFNSIVNHNVKNISKHLDARLSSHKTNECVHTFLYKTDKSDFTIGMSLGHSINLSSENYLNKEISNENKFISEFKVNSKMGQRIVFDKHVCFYTSRETSLGNISEETSNNVISAIDDGFEVLYEEHVSFWEQHWNIADIEIEGNIADQQALR